MVGVSTIMTDASGDRVEDLIARTVALGLSSRGSRARSKRARQEPLVEDQPRRGQVGLDRSAGLD